MAIVRRESHIGTGRDGEAWSVAFSERCSIGQNQVEMEAPRKNAWALGEDGSHRDEYVLAKLLL